MAFAGFTILSSWVFLTLGLCTVLHLGSLPVLLPCSLEKSFQFCAFHCLWETLPNLYL